MNELDDMKSMWNDLNKRLERLEEENRELAKEIMANKFLSVTERLASKYRKFMVLQIIWAVIMPAYILANHYVVEQYRWPTAVVFCVFFLLAFGVDFYLLGNIKKMDIYNSPVTEISRLAALNWKIHKLWIIFMLPFAFAAVLLLALALNANIYTLTGMACGVVLGVAIGTYQLLKFRSGYRLLQSSDIGD